MMHTEANIIVLHCVFSKINCAGQHLRKTRGVKSVTLMSSQLCLEGLVAKISVVAQTGVDCLWHVIPRQTFKLV